MEWAKSDFSFHHLFLHLASKCCMSWQNIAPDPLSRAATKVFASSFFLRELRYLISGFGTRREANWDQRDLGTTLSFFIDARARPHRGLLDLAHRVIEPIGMHFVQCLLCEVTYTGWPFSLCRTSRWLQKQKFHFGLARFCTSWMVTLYINYFH